MEVKKNLELYNGIKIPGIGYGTWRTPAGKETRESVQTAIRTGYRHIDTAATYQNEVSVGQGVRAAMDELGLERKDLFVTTKVWNDHRGYDLAMKAFEESMEKLQLDYVDLYLIHMPAVPKWRDDWREINASTWSALEELYKQGRVKAIGISNFLAHHVSALIEDTEIKPMVNQIEYHIGFGQEETAAYCQKEGMVVEAFSPLGSGGVLSNEMLAEVAAKYNKLPSQIGLRWLLQKQIIPLSKSLNPDRMASNLQLYDFEITEEDMKVLDSIPFCGGMGFNPDEAEILK